MGKYSVTVREVWETVIEVDASSEEEAIHIASMSDTERSDAEYSHDLPTEYWDIEENI